MNTLLFVLWFFLPAGIANTAPIFAAHLPFLNQFNYPLDAKKSFRGRRIFGDHKTIRGIISGIFLGIAVVVFEMMLYKQSYWIRSFVYIDYQHINPWIFGTLSALGALAGDAVKSFFKRQMNIQSGKSWFPFDQIDYIVGGVLFTMLYIKLSIYEYIILFIVWFLLHPISTFVGYVLKLKKDPI